MGAFSRGDRLGKFTIVGPIGSGGFASVYLAEHEALDSMVALKILADNFAMNPDIRDRFVREARLLRRIADPHVLNVLDLDETPGGQPFMVLEYCGRGDLGGRVRDLAQRGVGAGSQDIVGLIDALASALSSLHTSQVVHRDIKPSNVLIRTTPDTPDASGTRLVEAGERLVVADLGFAKDLGVASDLTAAGGTNGFAAPEQMSGSAMVDHRADLYSATALVVWVITGQSQATNASGDWAEQVLLRHPRPEFVTQLQRSLQHDRDHRHQSAVEWAAALKYGLTGAADVVPATQVVSTPEVAQATGWSDPNPTPEPNSGRREADRPTTFEIPAAPAPPSKAPGKGLVGAALAVLLLGGVGVAVAATGGDGGAEVERVAEGVRSSETAGDVTVAVVGPDSIELGEVAVLSADAGDATSFTWSASGAEVVGADQLAVTPRNAGTATVTLTATMPDGSTIEVDHRIDVTD